MASPAAPRALFGGAITACIPDGFVDVSVVRVLPDNQEVLAHQDTDRSFIVEILEMEADKDAAAALQYFYADLAGANGSTATVAEHTEIGLSVDAMPCLAASEGATASVLVGTQQVAKFREAATNTVRIFMCNLRLPRHKTDVLITFNTPVRLAKDSSSADAVAAGVAEAAAQPQGAGGIDSVLAEGGAESKDKQATDAALFRRAIQTFTIVNPLLFGE